MSRQNETDKDAIQELVDRWSIFSDAGEWDRFAECWHEDGYMCATWFQAPAKEFIAARRKGWENGVSILHFHGGFSCDVKGDRAVSQTKMSISQRAKVHDKLVDVLCTGRFYDFFVRTEDGWRMVRRQPIYEKDRMDTVEPGVNLVLDKKILDEFPEGYRHLAYLQTQIGYKVAKKGLPALKGVEVESLYKQGKAWLAGSESPGRPTLEH